jgi:hypothetical protein
MGFLWPAVYVVVLALITLTVVGWLEQRVKHRKGEPPDAERTE